MTVCTSKPIVVVLVPWSISEEVGLTEHACHLCYKLGVSCEQSECAMKGKGGRLQVRETVETDVERWFGRKGETNWKLGRLKCWEASRG